MTWSRHPPIGGADSDATHVVNTSTGAPPNAQILDDLTAGIAHVTSAGLVTTFSGLAWDNTNRALTVTNSTADTAAHAYADIAVQGTGGGDPHVRLTVPSGTSWHIGVDNSNSDVFAIGTGSAVGSNQMLSLSSSGAWFFLDGAGTTNASISAAGVLNARVQMSVASVPFAAADATFVEFGSIAGSASRRMRLYTSDTIFFTGLTSSTAFWSASFNMQMGGSTGVLATNATVGFWQAPTCAGAPTGAAPEGSFIADTTNHRWYFMSGGTWRNAGP